MGTDWGPAKAHLIAKTGTIEEATRRVKEMVQGDRPTLDILGALSRLREDVKYLEALIISSRLERLSQAAAGGEGLEPAIAELLDIVAPRRSHHLRRRARSRANGRAA